MKNLGEKKKLLQESVISFHSRASTGAFRKGVETVTALALMLTLEAPSVNAK